MRFLSSLLLASLPLFAPSCVSASSAGSASSGVITLPLSRRHMSIQALEEANGHAQHVMEKGRFKKFSSMAQPLLIGCPQLDFTTGVTVAGTTYELIVDTGSSSMAIVSNLCPNCPTPQYTPPAAKIVQGAPLATARFGDGSGWTGRVVQDNVSLLGTSAIPVKFVAIDTQTNNFFLRGTCTNFNARTFADQGIIGFAYQSLAVSATNTFFGQLVANTGIPNMFSMMECYTTGTMTLGGVTAGESSGLFFYTLIIQKAWYVIEVTNMLLGGQSIGLSAATFVNNGGNGPANAIVDSGTTLMILPPTAFNAMITALNQNRAFNAAFGQGAAAALAQGQCVQLLNGLTGQAAINFVNQNLPPMNIVVGAGFTLNLGAATSYLLPFDATTPAFCAGIANGGSTQTILGWPVVNQFVVIYDVANSQIGFATQVGCANGAGGTITAGTAQGQAAPIGGNTPVNPTQAPVTQAPVITQAPVTTQAPVATTAPTNPAPTTKPTTPPTVAPPSTTMNCPRGKFGPNCAMVYDVIQCVIGIPFQVVQTPGRNGNTFAMAFARDMAIAAGTTAANIMVLQAVDRGDKASTIVQFALLADSKKALIGAENKLAKNFWAAQANLVQAALFGQLSADQGLTILDNAGSGAEGLNADGVMMDNGGNGNGVPMGAIVGAAVGGVVLIVLVAGVIIYRRRASKSSTTVETTKQPTLNTTAHPVQPASKSAVAWYV